MLWMFEALEDKWTNFSENRQADKKFLLKELKPASH